METEHARWHRIFAAPEFFYGHEPGPVARRALRYHRPLLRSDQSANALDVGCGEGQDLLLLAQNGYHSTGLDFTETGLVKAKKLLHQNNCDAKLVRADIANWKTSEQFDLVLAVNCLQFLGAQAPRGLTRVKELVVPGGVIGLSMFARENETDAALDGAIYRWTLDELLANFAQWQPFEAARLWQWSGDGPQPFVTLIARAPFSQETADRRRGKQERQAL